MKPNFSRLFQQFNELTVLVIGDVMIDAYIEGRVDRISPEAPVPVLEYGHEYERLGGAANVALNTVSLGAKTIICSVAGDDAECGRLAQLFDDAGVDASGIVRSPARPTTVKTRVLGNHQQLLRVDKEVTGALNEWETQHLKERIEKILSIHQVDAIIMEDYDKGVLTAEVIEFIISTADEKGILTTADPKKLNFTAYKGVGMFKPNLKELLEGLHLVKGPNWKETVIEGLEKLQRVIDAKHLLVTLSENGVVATEGAETHWIQAHLRNIADVSGAGDTVISVATLALAAGAEIEWAAELANLAGGQVCEQPGVVPVDKDQLLNEVNKIS